MQSLVKLPKYISQHSFSIVIIYHTLQNDIPWGSEFWTSPKNQAKYSATYEQKNANTMQANLV